MRVPLTVIGLFRNLVPDVLTVIVPADEMVASVTTVPADQLKFPFTSTRPAPDKVPLLNENVPFTIRSSPVPSAIVSADAVRANVPPASTTTWSAVIIVFAVMVWPLRIDITPSAEDGGAGAAIQPEPSYFCHEPAAFQFPVALLL